MKIKKLLIVLLSMLTILTFVGCSNSSDTASARFYKTGHIFEIDRCNYGINVDRKTDNVYLVSTNDKTITPLYDKDGKITKYGSISSSLGGSTTDKERFYKTGEIYVIDKCDYGIFVDRQTNNCYLVSTNDKFIMPLYDKEGKITKYSDIK